jgi:hypothetical protein
MKPFINAIFLTILLTGCAVEPVAVRPAYIGPSYAIPSPGYVWQQHPQFGWGWHHPSYGWHRGWR